MLELSTLIGVAISLLLIAATLGYRSVFHVEQGYLAVISRFGRAVFLDEERKQLKTWGPGLHFKWPWEKVLRVGMMEHCLDLSGENKGIVAMAEDGTILRLDSKLRYSPMKDELYHYLFALRQPVEHIKGLFTCLLRNEIANFRAEGEAELAASRGSDHWAGSYAVIRRERKLLNRHIENFSKQQIAGRYGVRFNAIDLTDILPPDELAEALNAVIDAQMEADTHYAKAEGECQQRIMSAEKSVAIEAAKAEAVETEILTLAKFLEELAAKGMLDQYIDRRRTEVYSESNRIYVKKA
jgi:regulator of protease activity HflC (stomatin/prohibitin superfamily)